MIPFLNLSGWYFFNNKKWANLIQLIYSTLNNETKQSNNGRLKKKLTPFSNDI